MLDRRLQVVLMLADAEAGSVGSGAGLIDELGNRTYIRQNGLLLVNGRLSLSEDLGALSSVVWFNPPISGEVRLANAGFRSIHNYLVRPSFRQARWILPAFHHGKELLDFYSPSTAKGRLLKGLTQVASYLPYAKILIANRSASSLIRKLAITFSVDDITLMVSTGTPGAYNKATAKVMNRSGGTLGFAKVAYLSNAVRALEQEEAMLAFLATRKSLEGHIPRVLDSVIHQGGRVMVVSVGPSLAAPQFFTEVHERFLARLHCETGNLMPFCDSTMYQSMKAKLTSISHKLSAAWHHRLVDSMELLETKIGQTMLPVAVAHRDFVPWNMRVNESGELFVFDWEASRPNYVIHYDRFHFCLFTNLFLKGPISVTCAKALLLNMPADQSVPIPILFLAYCTDIALHYLEAAQGDSAVEVHDVVLRQLAVLFDGRDEWLS